MMIKFIYETAPYTYLITGGFFLFTPSSMLISSGGLLLFIAGSSIWIKRSLFRSRTSRHYPVVEYLNHNKTLDQAVDRYKTPYRIPAWLYEYLPFIYLLAGCSCYRYQQAHEASMLILIAAILFVLAGICSWGMRGYFRGYHTRHLLSESLS
ncbi:MAG: hypothetical protein V7739_00040 [Motiliproteus sp.]